MRFPRPLLFRIKPSKARCGHAGDLKMCLAVQGPSYKTVVGFWGHTLNSEP